MNRLRSALILLAALIAMPDLAKAADSDDAAAAARLILTRLQAGQYEAVWNENTSDWFRKRTTKDSFLANMSLGRQSLGGSTSPPEFVDMSYAKADPATNYQGEIYAFNFRTSYAVGKFYERIVVIKDTDGQFRLSGVFGSPAK
jgi:hypothetical protein